VRFIRGFTIHRTVVNGGFHEPLPLADGTTVSITITGAADDA
jgi:hypothetical protein